MIFILFVEGHTEKQCISAFLKKWLDPQLDQPVGVKPVRFDGWAQLIKDVEIHADLYLNGRGSEDVIAVISLLDLYGPTIYPSHLTSVAQRENWGREYIQNKVGHAKFRHFFAVHETEAWLLSQPTIFPEKVQAALPDKTRNPEKVNFDEPPAKLLNFSPSLIRRTRMRNVRTSR